MLSKILIRTCFQKVSLKKVLPKASPFNLKLVRTPALKVSTFNADEDHSREEISIKKDIKEKEEQTANCNSKELITITELPPKTSNK